MGTLSLYLVVGAGDQVPLCLSHKDMHVISGNANPQDLVTSGGPPNTITWGQDFSMCTEGGPSGSSVLIFLPPTCIPELRAQRVRGREAHGVILGKAVHIHGSLLATN